MNVHRAANRIVKYNVLDAILAYVRNVHISVIGVESKGAPAVLLWTLLTCAKSAMLISHVYKRWYKRVISANYVIESIRHLDNQAYELSTENLQVATQLDP